MMRKGRKMELAEKEKKKKKNGMDADKNERENEKEEKEDAGETRGKKDGTYDSVDVKEKGEKMKKEKRMMLTLKQKERQQLMGV